MPVYPYSCECGREVDKAYPVSESWKSPRCTCGQQMYKDFSRITVTIDQTLGYYDKQLGAYVQSTSDRRRIAKEKGLVACTRSEANSIKRKEKTESERKAEYKQIIKDAAYNANIPLPGVS